MRGAPRRSAAVAADTEVGVKLVLAEIVKGGPGHTARVGAQHPLEEALNKTTHRKGSPPTTMRDGHLGTFRGRSSVTASVDLGDVPPNQAIPGVRPTPRPREPKPTPGTVAFPLAPLQCRSSIYTMFGAENLPAMKIKLKGTQGADRCEHEASRSFPDLERSGWRLVAGGWHSQIQYHDRKLPGGTGPPA